METKTRTKIAVRKKELHDLMEEQKPKIEAAKVIASKLKEIGVDTRDLDDLITAVTAFTADTDSGADAGSGGGGT